MNRQQRQVRPWMHTLAAIRAQLDHQFGTQEISGYAVH